MRTKLMSVYDTTNLSEICQSAATLTLDCEEKSCKATQTDLSSSLNDISMFVQSFNTSIKWSTDNDRL